MLKGLLRNLLIATGVVGGSGILYLLLLDSVIMPRIVDVSRVTVPNVGNRTVPEAQRLIKQMGLRLTLRDSVYSDAPVGHVIDQEPGSGEHIKRARRVFVDVSRGPRRYLVPNITGGSQREARLQILGRQLLVGTVRLESSTAIPDGVVLRQSPVAGLELPRQGKVDLVVSSGSPFSPKDVPDVVGVSIQSVEDTLAKYEMRLGEIDERVAEHVLPGQILAQQPAGGALVPRHTPIDLVVSVRPVQEPE
ncbi:MAG: PASTA domain-containing protein [Gemmatimonadetes bacterium]|jgi:eukaryotic-like serine/threonine-protein kinase|nr:PASTA domain-containing protein [Gemmatimonadota bacterium]MBT7860727.1 PASTA domain-containing protein [Gemmatimonadota bacterium]